MYAGQLVLAQLMDHLPWQRFRRILERYGADRRIREFSCSNQLRCMALAQLAYRESLRDIETCLRAQSVKIAGMEMCWSYNRQHGARFLALMPTNLYGPGEGYDLKNSHLLPALITKIHKAKQSGAR